MGKKTLYSFFSREYQRVKNRYPGKAKLWKVLAQPEGVMAFSGSYPVCPLSSTIKVVAEIADISYNARCFCLRFEVEGINYPVGFCACRTIRAEIQPNAKTLQRSVLVYREIHQGKNPWQDGMSTEEWLNKILRELDGAKYTCPIYRQASIE